MTRHLCVMLTLGLVVGCAARTDRSPASAVEPTPDWSTAKGRHGTQLQLAESLIDLGRTREAMTLLATLRQDSDKPELEVDVLYARATLKMGMAGESAAILEPWLDHPPRDADFHALLGLVRFDQAQLDDAEVAFVRAIELDAGHFDAHNNLGFLLLGSDRPQPAIQHFRSALAVRPNDPRARNNLGFALAAAGKEREALEVFRAINPESQALSNMGLACERGGELDDAIAWYNRALERDPAHATAAAAIQRLQASSEGATPP